RVVADHAAERAVLMRRWVRAERQAMPSGVGPQGVQYHARLYLRGTVCGVDRENPVQVLREVEHHGRIARLPGQTRAGAAAHDRRVVSRRDAKRRFDIGFVTGDDHADGNVAVVGGVAGIEGARPTIETDLARHDTSEI